MGHCLLRDVICLLERARTVLDLHSATIGDVCEIYIKEEVLRHQTEILSCLRDNDKTPLSLNQKAMPGFVVLYRKDMNFVEFVRILVNYLAYDTQNVVLWIDFLCIPPREFKMLDKTGYDLFYSDCVGNALGDTVYKGILFITNLAANHTLPKETFYHPQTLLCLQKGLQNHLVFNVALSGEDECHFFSSHISKLIRLKPSPRHKPHYEVLQLPTSKDECLLCEPGAWNLLKRIDVRKHSWTILCSRVLAYLRTCYLQALDHYVERNSILEPLLDDFYNTHLVFQEEEMDKDGTTLQSEAHQRCHRIIEEVASLLGYEHAETLRLIATAAEQAMQLRIYGEAPAWLSTWHQYVLAFEGPSHPASLRASALLGGYCANGGDFYRALELLTSSLTQQRIWLSDNVARAQSEASTKAVHVLAATRDLLDYTRPTTAISTDDERECYPANSAFVHERDIQYTLFTLGTLYYDLNNFTDADRLLSECHTRQVQSLGVNHRHTLRSLLKRACLYNSQRKLAMAQSLFKAYLDAAAHLHRPSSAPHDGDYRMAMEHLANLYILQWHYEDALSLLQILYDSGCALHGPHHELTLETLSHLAACYVKMERFGEAERCYVALLQTGVKVLGPGHPSLRTWRSAYEDCIKESDEWLHDKNDQLLFQASNVRKVGQQRGRTSPPRVRSRALLENAPHAHMKDRLERREDKCTATRFASLVVLDTTSSLERSKLFKWNPRSVVVDKAKSSGHHLTVVIDRSVQTKSPRLRASKVSPTHHVTCSDVCHDPQVEVGRAAKDKHRSCVIS